MKKIIPPIIIITFVSLVFIYLGAKYYCIELFNYNLMDIITAGFVSFGIYYLTKLSDEKKSKNNKIEDIVQLINTKLNSTFSSPIVSEKQQQYLLAFKYIDNKILILESMSKHLKCEKEIENIKAERYKLDEFITENLYLAPNYFLRDTVKDKIPNILSNIEIHLSSIILKIYEVY